ncbi:MAG TPA: YbhB/YbcL family Raf kinase inhibitor-like protein [Candidatus Binatia bacterium]|nr:YbhB/YbcL family Raf kinase inhibitor-like protein [Candidatus Binatia bacterium]
MLGRLPAGIGHALRDVRPGLSKLMYFSPEFAGVPESIAVLSPAFEDGWSIPERYTSDGEGISPPLVWSGVPEAASSMVLLVEDIDSPTPRPLVHAIVWNLPGADGVLPDGAISADSGVDELVLGRNSGLKAAWLPPDPPPGHGTHRYAFQLFALDTPAGFKRKPGRAALLKAMRGNAIAKGCLIGTYGRSARVRKPS